MSVELNPCPNTECRRYSILTRSTDNLGYFYVRCSGCEARGPYSRGKEEAARLWNLLPRAGDLPVEVKP